MTQEIVEVGALVKQVVAEVVAPGAKENDTTARFPQKAIEELGRTGLLGLIVPVQHGGMGQGPMEAARVVASLSEADASVGMVYLMHLAGTACITAAPEDADVGLVLEKIAAGEHLTTLAFSEKGSRSHFWAPVSRAQNGQGIRVSADKSFVTSANHADSYVVATQALSATQPMESTLYLLDRNAEGVAVQEGFDGLGLRANDSAPVRLTNVVVPQGRRLSPEGGGFDMMVNTVLPLFNLGSAAVSLGICRAATQVATTHLGSARFEHLDQTLGEAAPQLRAHLAKMRIQTDTLEAFVEQTVKRIEAQDEAALLSVLQVKALGGETAKNVTSLGMQACGGAAFSRKNAMERHFRDAQAATVMAPTTEVLEDLIAKALLGMPLF